MKIESRKKSGIALSGGGFRASLYHIGVLASLAEKNLLKDIEVISCVSGGSIIGAVYYLHLKKLLETKTDNEIKKEDYIEIVKKIEQDFLIQMEKNYSVSALSNFIDNFKMSQKNYSISDKLAELYNEGFYEGLKYDGFKPLRDDGMICMTDLLIKPKEFEVLPKHIREINQERQNKIPMIIINATTLNTGRNWQFEGKYMGERISDDYNEIDFESNVRLSIFSYDKLPEGNKYKLFPLSVAVASSACVPGIFEPLPLTDLYKDVLPQLVDGGVYDNQGIIPLVYEKCSDVIISDASKQIDFLDEPAIDLFRVAGRANSILMERVRYLSFEIKCILKNSESVKSLNVIHLRKDLNKINLSPGDAYNEKRFKEENTRYGILKNLQYLISNIRTNLDAFSEAESCAIMFSGYSMSNYFIDKEDQPKPDNRPWKFLKIEKYLNGSQESKRLKKILITGKAKFFKIFRLMPALIPIGLLNLAIAVAPLFVLYKLIVYFAGEWFIYAVLIIVILVLVSSYITKFFTFKNLLIFKVSNLIVTFGIALFGFIYTQLYLRTLNPFYIKYGRLEKLK